MAHADFFQLNKNKKITTDKHLRLYINCTLFIICSVPHTVHNFICFQIADGKRRCPVCHQARTASDKTQDGQFFGPVQ